MRLNIGINEGEVFFGMIRSAPTVEFAALGDSIDYAIRLCDFARDGEIWATKTVLSKLDSNKLKNIQFGVSRNVQGTVSSSRNAFSRVIDLIGSEDKDYGKFIDIANLSITQLIDNNPE
jgi:adenylate cyclase